MESLSDLLRELMNGKGDCGEQTTLTEEESLQLRCDMLNTEPGKRNDGDDYDCPECMNRGGSYFIREGCIIFRRCGCEETRKTIRNIGRSGAKELLETCTFDTFKTPEKWQERIKTAALEYLEDMQGNWFYAGGQIGCGKTHICTAILGELLKRGMSCRYMQWKADSTRLKALINEDGYCKELDAYKHSKVLYIDDFFKMPPGKTPTDGDLNLAFELLNHRYINRSLVTIISSEHDLDTLVSFDEAIGSRIYERSRKHQVLIGRDINKNQRR